jgi:hypothetical protein
MDAKVLRAAVSAAIRVTVSTTLIGCGGNVTSDAGGAAGATTGGVATSAKGNGKSAGDTIAPSYPLPSGTPSSGGTGGGGVAGGGWSMGGQPTAGTGSGATAPMSEAGASEGGAAGSSGEAPSVCACTATLAEVKPGEALSSDALACCQVVIDAYLTPAVQEEACWFDFQWFVQPAHQQCCAAISDAWQQPACTPWGPPVPPEAPLSALLDWELAA